MLIQLNYSLNTFATMCAWLDCKSTQENKLTQHAIVVSRTLYPEHWMVLYDYHYQERIRESMQVQTVVWQLCFD